MNQNISTPICVRFTFCLLLFSNLNINISTPDCGLLRCLFASVFVKHTHTIRILRALRALLASTRSLIRRDKKKTLGNQCTASITPSTVDFHTLELNSSAALTVWQIGGFLRPPGCCHPTRTCSRTLTEPAPDSCRFWRRESRAPPSSSCLATSPAAAPPVSLRFNTWTHEHVN